MTTSQRTDADAARAEVLSFGAALARARRQRGFESAYQFYHRNGGRRIFAFTYQYYLKVERGSSLPSPAWLKLILRQLRMQEGYPPQRELLLAYLRDMVGGGGNFDWIVAPYLCAHGPQGQPALRETGKLLRREHSFNLTPEQFKAVAGDEATYWCFEMLFSDRDNWTARELAETFGLKERAAERALERLRELGLAKRSGSGRFFNPRVGKHYSFPSLAPGADVSLALIRSYWEKMFLRKGRKLCDRVVLLRAEMNSISNFLPLFLDPLNAVGACSVFEKGDNTAFFTLETRIRKLFDA